MRYFQPFTQRLLRWFISGTDEKSLQTLSWLPVDIAAEVVLDITLGDHLWDASREPVFHVVNTDTSTSWGSVLSWIEELGIKFSRVSPSQWVKALSGIEDGEEDPSRKLLGLWESKVSSS